MRGASEGHWAGPLAGIRIVDLSIALSGPWAVGILADQGADVVKVEPPGIGDIGRWVGPAIGGVSAMAQIANRGKRSIAVDLHKEAGLDLVRRLAARADVFVQNFRPGVIERLGLGYEALSSANPRLVYVSISGFGATGPYAHKSAYDPVVQAYAGLAAVQAGAEGVPQLIRHTAADKITSLTASQAITAALFARERASRAQRADGERSPSGGSGQHLEISMLESVVNFVWADAAGNEVLLDSDGKQPSSFSRDQKLWPTKDGYVIAAPVSDGDVAAICRGVGVDGYDDPMVATIFARRQNPEAFQALLRRVYAAVADMTTAEAIRGMEAERAPCGAVVGPAELHRDPQVAALGVLEDSLHPAAGRVRQPRPPARFGATPAKTGAPAPTIGQHTDEILVELGMGDQIAALRAGKIVA
ncbi:MAG TPA: CoA transferase [Myxococcota bacterium]|nr:CoA transferase [Myxococcota bacterium]